LEKPNGAAGKIKTMKVADGFTSVNIHPSSPRTGTGKMGRIHSQTKNFYVIEMIALDF
jgi:hypothetical protein